MARFARNVGDLPPKKAHAKRINVDKMIAEWAKKKWNVREARKSA